MSFKLKYLFEVGFTDGTTLKQNEEDRSDLDPDKRSCWYDVLNRGVPISWIVIFDDNGNQLGVDLLDGHFEVNGQFFFGLMPNLSKPLEPVYYRQHTHHMNLNGEEQGHIVKYVIGWKQDDNKQIIGVF